VRPPKLRVPRSNAIQRKRQEAVILFTAGHEKPTETATDVGVEQAPVVRPEVRKCFFILAIATGEGA
jgi:hypothetical protein